VVLLVGAGVLVVAGGVVVAGAVVVARWLGLVVVELALGVAVFEGVEVGRVVTT
jgi:hypothetical protein